VLASQPKPSVNASMSLHSKPFLLITSLVVPMLLIVLGFWQMQRGAEYHDYLFAQRADLKAQVRQMEAVPPPTNGGINTELQFHADGTNYMGDFALVKAREALGQFDFLLTVARIRQVLPIVFIAASSAVFALGLAILAGAISLAGIGGKSRPALLRSFSLVRRLLPAAMIMLVVLSAFAVIGAILFEVAPLFRWDNIGSGQIYLLSLALGLVAVALVTAYHALMQLRGISQLFAPEPLVLIAQSVSQAEAPGLWALVENFARRLSAPMPDTIALGVTQGFFVVSGPVQLLPADQRVEGNTLHVSLGHLALMRTDEAATVIAHELAHFAGEDTTYSQSYLPIYNGFSRSLDAMARVGQARDGSLSFLTTPALALGYFVLERFHLAVRHWSRAREFEADTKSATLTSQGAAGRALLRHGAINGVIEAVTNFAWAQPDQAPQDLVAYMLELASERGLNDPTLQLEAVVAHPTDTHPHNRDRLAAFGFEPTQARVADAMTLPASADAVLAQYFADASATSRNVTQALLAASRGATLKWRDTVSSIAASVGDEATELYENNRPIAIFMFAIAAPMLAIAMWTALFGAPGFGREILILSVGFGIIGTFIALLGVQALRRAKTPFMRLFPDRIEHRHLDRPIYWDQLRNWSVGNHAGTMVTSFLLKRSATFPKRRGGRGQVLLNPGAWVVTIRSVPPQHYKSGGYIDLITRYADAAAARNSLAARPADPDVPGASSKNS